MDAVPKYLASHAEPEIALSAHVGGGYARALVVPARREDPSLLDGYVAAAQTSGGRTLVILVANAPDDADEAEQAAAAAFLEATRAGLKRVQALPGSSAAFLGARDRGSLDVLVVDRASAGARIPKKEGVGLARKIGFDLALALHVEKKVASRMLYGTDADATLPEAFFDRPDLDDHPGISAAVFPFWHVPAEDPVVSVATAAYELSLRYYVEGLSWAGSPYAFHTLGSATAVTGEAYAAVRGMPKRDAAEDFYLLNKIAKVGAVVRATGAPIRIASRQSDRTPFGTGAAVSEAIATRDSTLYAPACFEVLCAVLGRLDALAADADVPAFFSSLPAAAGPAHDAVKRLFDDLGAGAALEAAAREAKTEEARRRRLHTWFDAFRTLKLIHAAEAVHPRLPARDALHMAPFMRGLEASAEHEDPLRSNLRTALLRRDGGSIPWTLGNDGGEGAVLRASFAGPTVPPAMR